MKRIAWILVAITLIATLAGCSGGGGSVKTEASDAHVKITLTIPQSEYTGNDIIPVTVTITNTGSQSIHLVKGSGSNAVPDALQVDLGGFANLFTPEIATMDYQIIEVKPGKTETHTLPFVPYLPNDGINAFGFDRDISFFQTDGFTPAAKGLIEGSFALSYAAFPEGETNLMITEETELQTVGGTFTIKIV